MLRNSSMPGLRVSPPGTGRRHDRVAGIEQHGAALLHVGVDALERLVRRPRRAGHDRPIDQRKERQFVVGDIEADRIAGLERGALRQEQRQSRKPGLADGIDLGVAGDDIGELWSRSAAGGTSGFGDLCAPGLRAASSASNASADHSGRGRARHAAASAAGCRRRARARRARRSATAPARRGKSGRADRAARWCGRLRGAHWRAGVKSSGASRSAGASVFTARRPSGGP